MTTLVIHTDGGSRGNPGPAAIGMVFIADGKVILEDREYLGPKTNNEAEYTAFFTSLKILKQHLPHWQPQSVLWHLDSKLVIEQLNRNWKIKEPRMKQFAQQIWLELETLSIPFKISYVPREENAAADALVNQALDAQQV